MGITLASARAAHENPLQMSMPGRHRLFRRSFPRTTAVSTVIPIAAIRNRVNGL